MQSIQNQLASYREKGRRFSRWQKAVIFLACIVVFCTVYALILPAITLEGNLSCGKEEHVHTDACYENTVVNVKETLICTKEEVEPHSHTDSCYEIREVEIQVEETIEAPLTDTEEGAGSYREEMASGNTDTQATRTETVIRTEIQKEKVLVCEREETEGHLHEDGCYEKTEVYGERKLRCGMEAHQHTKICYVNPDADVETEAEWRNTFADVTFTKDWIEDTLAIAETQLGYHESRDNYVVSEGEEPRGYTRYGAWYGNPYGDWCAMFVSFCLHYADVENFPLEAGCQSWISKIKELEDASRDKDGEIQYDAWRHADEEYIPKRGNLIFFDWDAEGNSDHVGLVVETKDDEDGNITVKTIEGNTSDIVSYREYSLEDSLIMGYGILPKQRYFCGMTGHAHDDDCYDDADNLICKANEHIHKLECEEKNDNASVGSEAEGDNGAATVADTEPVLTEVCVSKHWTEAAPVDTTVEVALYANDQQTGKVVSLDVENDWSHKWTDLNKYDDVGNLIAYSIREKAVKEYHSSIKNISSKKPTAMVWKKVSDLEAGSQYLLVSDDGAVKEADGQIAWVYAHPEDVDLCSQDLIWTAETSEEGEIELHNNATGYVIREDDNLEGIHVADCTIYRLTEKELPQAENNFILTNTKNTRTFKESAAGEFVKVSVRNLWAGRLDSAYPEGVKVQLMQNGQAYDIPLELCAENDWMLTWFQLPKADNDGNAFRYTVKETAVDYYIAEQETSTDEDGNLHIDITNTWMREDVTVALHKVDANNMEKYLANAEFDLYLKTEEAEGEITIPDTETVKGVFKEHVEVGSEGIASMHLAAGETYYLIETKPPDGYNCLVEPIGFKADKKGHRIELSLADGEKWAETMSGTDGILIVKNSNGYVLPRVGGSGTTFYIMTGAALVLSALCLMHIKRKRRESEI